jgi:hypothetical protein
MQKPRIRSGIRGYKRVSLFWHLSSLVLYTLEFQHSGSQRYLCPWRSSAAAGLGPGPYSPPPGRAPEHVYFHVKPPGHPEGYKRKTRPDVFLFMQPHGKRTPVDHSPHPCPQRFESSAAYEGPWEKRRDVRTLSQKGGSSSSSAGPVRWASCVTAFFISIRNRVKIRQNTPNYE